MEEMQLATYKGFACGVLSTIVAFAVGALLFHLYLRAKYPPTRSDDEEYDEDEHGSYEKHDPAQWWRRGSEPEYDSYSDDDD